MSTVFRVKWQIYFGLLWQNTKYNSFLLTSLLHRCLTICFLATLHLHWPSTLIGLCVLHQQGCSVVKHFNHIAFRAQLWCMSLNLQSLVVEKCPSMSVWAFCVHRQINRAGGVTDLNNLVHYSRHFQMLRKVPIFLKLSLGPSCLLPVCDPRWALLSRGGSRRWSYSKQGS